VPEIIWKQEPDPHDYPAAASYLSLVAVPDLVNLTVAALKAAPVGHSRRKISCVPPNFSSCRPTTRTSRQTWPGSSMADDCPRFCWFAGR